jgi:hypothetical protein
MCLWNEPIQTRKRCYEISNGGTKERRTSSCPVLDWNGPCDQSPGRHFGVIVVVFVVVVVVVVVGDGGGGRGVWLYESGNYRSIDTSRLRNKERNLD